MSSKRLMWGLWLLPLLTTIVAVRPVQAVETRALELVGIEDYIDGELHEVYLNEEGRLTPGAAQQVLALEDDRAVKEIWDTLVRGDGTVYAVTGEPARVLRWTGDEAPQTIFEHEEAAAFTAIARDGEDLLIAAIPGGLVYRLSRDGDSWTGEVWADLEDEFIWDLLLQDHTLYAATGPEGHLVAIGADGKTEILLDSESAHLLCLSSGPDDSVLAGSSDDALLYQVQRGGAVRVLHDFDGDEVKAIAWDGAESIYVGVNESAGRRGARGRMARGPKPSNGNGLFQSDDDGDAPAQAGGDAPPPPVRIPRMQRLTGALHLVTPQGAAEQLDEDPRRYVLALAVERSGRVIVGTGPEGEIFGMDADRTRWLLARLDAGDVTGLSVANGHWRAAAASNGGTLLALDPDRRGEGRYVSSALDAGSVTRWGAMHFSASGDVEVRVRGGNSENLDEAWGEWSSGFDDSPRSLSLAATRYLQVEVTLEDADSSFERARIFHTPQNQRPSIKQFLVDGGEEGPGGRGGPNPGGPGGDRGGDPGGNGSPHADKPALMGEVTWVWAATDPDGDELEARIWLREAGAGNPWVPTDNRDYRKTNKWRMDTRTVPDGRYDIKLVLSDEPGNPVGEALTAEEVMLETQIDNGPPTVEDFDIHLERRRLEVEAVDTALPLAGAQWSVDGGDWHHMALEDGVADSLRETFVADLPLVEPGPHLVAVRVLDRAGNQSQFQRIVQFP